MWERGIVLGWIVALGCGGAGPRTDGARSGEAVVLVTADCGLTFDTGVQWTATVREVLSGSFADQQFRFVASNPDARPLHGHFKACHEPGVKLRLHRVDGTVPPTYSFLGADGTDWVVDSAVE